MPVGKASPSYIYDWQQLIYRTFLYEKKQPQEYAEKTASSCGYFLGIEKLICSKSTVVGDFKMPFYMGQYPDTFYRYGFNRHIYGVPPQELAILQIDDITEKTYTHRTVEDLHQEIQKIK